MNLSDPARRRRLDLLAAEYVLGTLPARARIRFRRVAAADAMVAGAIGDWERRLSGLADGLPGVMPPPRVWTRIASRLGLASGESTGASSGSWWGRVAFWRVFALASFAGLIALGIAQYKGTPAQGGEGIVVVMAGPDAKPVFVAASPRGDRVMRVKAVAAVAIPADKSLELWMLPGQGDPISLGLVDATGTATLTLRAPAGTLLAGMTALALSLEPAGGSPTGKPTGPVLYTGTIQQI
jgi:anti-sigma-K factor RskA